MVSKIKKSSYICKRHGDIGDSVMFFHYNGQLLNTICFLCYAEFLKENLGSVEEKLPVVSLVDARGRRHKAGVSKKEGSQ